VASGIPDTSCGAKALTRGVPISDGRRVLYSFWCTQIVRVTARVVTVEEVRDYEFQR